MATKKLKQHKYRVAAGQYLIEGRHLVAEAVKAHVEIDAIYCLPELAELPWVENAGAVTYLINESIAEVLSDTPANQGIFAVLPLPQIPKLNFEQGCWLALDRVQDPGNIGTMIRTADAAGYTGVILGEGSGDVYGPKVLRSMQGSNFHLIISHINLHTLVPELVAKGMTVYGTALDPKAKDYQAVAKTEPLMLVMGNEGRGMDSDLLKETTTNLYIPITGQAESLNVAVAAGILMFELR